MYRHILIPTDGSQLSQNAIAHGAALAKSINAKVTILTVSTPFHTFAVEPEMVTDTPEQYAKHMANRAAKYLNSATEDAAAAGRELRHGTRRARSPVSGHHRRGGTGAMRSYRHGLARPARSICDHAGQRNSQSADS